MATLSIETIDRDGLAPSLVAAAVGGDKFANTGEQFLYIDNADVGAAIVTIVTPQTVDTLAVTDRAVSVPAGTFKLIGPFPPSTYNDGSDDVSLTYDQVTSLTVGILRL